MTLSMSVRGLPVGCRHIPDDRPLGWTDGGSVYVATTVPATVKHSSAAAEKAATVISLGPLRLHIPHLPMLIDVDKGLQLRRVFVPEGLSEVRLDKPFRGLMREIDRRRIVVPRHLVRQLLRVGILGIRTHSTANAAPCFPATSAASWGSDGLTRKLRHPLL